MAATLTRSLRFDPASSTLNVKATAYVSPYTDPVTHVPAKSFYYNASLDQTVVQSGLSGGTATIAFSKGLGQGLHSLDIFAGNATSGERVSFGADITVATAASSGQTIFGEDDTIGSTRVDYAYGSQHGDAFFMGQNDDMVFGYGGNDYIDGGTGADSLVGGRGDDVYVVDNAGDATVELAGEGRDTVLSTISWTLSKNVEDLRLGGDTPLSGTGNELDNLIVGNDGTNALTGHAGNDTLEGGGGHDTLLGGAGNDTLDGGAGADRMEGGAGNDTYIVDMVKGIYTPIGDTVVEAANAGIDRVYANVTVQLGDNVEHLHLTGEGNINGFGNALANEISGNDRDNFLFGAEGVDTLRGGAGQDTLDGGAGNDRLNGGAGQDRLAGGAGSDAFEFQSVTDSSYGAGNADQIDDFVKGSDRIDVSAIDANEVLAGNQAFRMDTDGILAVGEIGQLKVGGMTILTFNTAGDATPEMMIMVQGQHTFTSGDFWL
ncbi:calcium-binding protein [Aureimonas phyllosphaerae]|uniref:Ca2+-binding RTX toxin-like protein n=1 Tax=Aureimonas phyllosphaerae TaxID=1166078 RepID=A0A7W6BVV9_9HYPH|nr:calcium-binding protein [Aureimonas phyllosphaerae]MBB3937029.1 Ca2+-binding RTX toxin-like protein [Aureimonas phyllosphaerae]MBB3960856.1 Ca2+-binding RTX toxin-like protein [Aureimonas phyllosphaerae]SFF60612.1 Hemolysin-type calcium-binding repeat-containing protein [Aureimonas phyllosphaerae]